MFRARSTLTVLCACIAAWPSFAQEGPTEEELENARLRLQQALEGGGLPPAAFETDPIPDWAVPNHEPKVLTVPEAGTQPQIPAKDDAREIATPAAPPRENEAPPVAEKKSEPEKSKSAEKPKPKQKPKPEKPAIARKKDQPLKSGRAVADDTQQPQPKPRQPPAPDIVLPERLRP